MGARVATLAEESPRKRRKMLAFLGFDGNCINISSSRINSAVDRYFYLLLHSLCLFLLTYSHTSHTLASSTCITTKNRVGPLITSEILIIHRNGSHPWCYIKSCLRAASPQLLRIVSHDAFRCPSSILVVSSNSWCSRDNQP